MPDAFIRIAPDDSVTVLIKHLDMGQGVTTGLTTIVAEELDADWSQMRAEFAPANAKLYNGRYRPMFYHSVRAGLDASGKLLAWRHRLAGQSFILGTPLESNLVKSGVDVTAVEGIVDMPYAIPNLQVDWRNAASPVTTLWWRSVGHTHTAHAVEVMIDELAQAANKDSLRVEGSSPSPQRLGRLDRRRVSMPQKFQFLFQGRLRLRRCRIKPTLLAVIISLGRSGE